MRIRIVFGAVVLVALTACGSTASPYRQAQLRNGTNGASEGLSPGTQSSPGFATTDDGGTTSVSQLAGGNGQTSVTTPGGTRTTTRLPANRPNGPGVSDKTITIGMVHVVNNAAAQAALGNTAGTAGDPKGEAQAVVRDVNAKGGIRGRTLEVVFHEVDATGSQTADQLAQAACADFTEDHKVLVTIAFASQNYLDCTARAGTVATAGSLTSMSDETYAKNPFFYDMQAISTNKLVRNFVATLERDKYFTPWDAAAGGPGNAPVKVGIVIPDQPHWDAVLDKELIPALAAIGHRVAKDDVKRWNFPESNADNGTAIAQIQSAILKFRSRNITHVLPMDVNSIGFFAQPAEAQRYRPRYGLNTTTQVSTFAGNLVPYAQLKGALGLGWSPAIDLPASQNSTTGPYVGPGLKNCLDVMAKAGFTFPDQTARGIALIICDEIYSIRDAINAIPNGAPIDATSYMQAIEGFGTKFPIAGLPIASFGPGKHFPVQRGYHWSFDDKCPCMRYTGAPFDLS